jgi:hypothetical protein
MKTLIGAGLICALLALFSTAHAEADLTGVWKIKRDNVDLASAAVAKPVFTPAGQSRYEQNRAAVTKRDVSVDLVQRCSSPGMPRILLLPYSFEILQESGYIAMVFEWNQLFRQILLKGERDRFTLPSAMGFSKGEWDGDTLVVTTTDRNDTTLLDNSGLPHGAMLKLTERLQLKSGGKVLEDRVTIDDAEFYQQPWTVVLQFDRQHTTLQEDVCLDRVAAGRTPIETPAERRKAERKH